MILIFLFVDCCRFLNVQYSDSSRNVYEAMPYIFQVYEMQHDEINGRPYFVGIQDNTRAIAFSNCGGWVIQPTSSRLVCVTSEDVNDEF